MEIIAGNKVKYIFDSSIFMVLEIKGNKVVIETLEDNNIYQLIEVDIDNIYKI